MIFPVPQNRPGVKTISQNKGDTSMYVSMYLCMLVCINVYTHRYIYIHTVHVCMYVLYIQVCCTDRGWSFGSHAAGGSSVRIVGTVSCINPVRVETPTATARAPAVDMCEPCKQEHGKVFNHPKARGRPIIQN